jgi:regulator of protease activity HflC (stomatin/prohibitin superfamily)
MINFFFFVLFALIFNGIGWVVAGPNPFIHAGALVLAFLLSLMIRIARQWERCVILRLGKLWALKGPGLFFVIPIVDEVITVDTRVITADIPKQQVITQDNVPVEINGVLYFKVIDPRIAITEVQSYFFAISQYAQTALRDVVGGMTLDQLLSEREKIGEGIEQAVEKAAKEWGLDVAHIKLQDIDMPEELKKMMSRQASAEREKRATITKAEGDKLAAFNLAEAAGTMLKSPGAMQLRTLQTIDGLGPTASNTVVLAIPIEIMDAVRAIAQSKVG